MDDQDRRRKLKFKANMARLEQNRTNYVPGQKQICVGIQSKSTCSQQATGCDIEESGHNKNFPQHRRNTVEEDDDDDVIFSDSFLYCKPSSTIGKRKVLKKMEQTGSKNTSALDCMPNQPVKHQPLQTFHQKTPSSSVPGYSKLPIDGGDRKDIVEGQLAKSSIKVLQTCSNNQSYPLSCGDCSRASNFQGLQPKSCLKQHPPQVHQKPQKTQTFPTLHDLQTQHKTCRSIPSPPGLYAEVPRISNVEGLQLKPSLKQYSPQALWKPQRTQTYLAPQDFQAQHKTCSSIPSPPGLYAEAPRVSNVEGLQLKPCSRQYSPQAPRKPQKTLTYATPQDFQAHNFRAGPVSGHFDQLELVDRMCRCSAGSASTTESLTENFEVFSNKITKDDVANKHAKGLLNVVTEDEDFGRLGLPRGAINIQFPIKEDCDRKCSRCNKAVYFAERRIAGGLAFHPGCFSCFTCGKHLDSKTLQEKNSEIYCKPCFNA